MTKNLILTENWKWLVNEVVWKSPWNLQSLKYDLENEFFKVRFTNWSGFKAKKLYTLRDRELAKNQAEHVNQAEPLKRAYC